MISSAFPSTLSPTNFYGTGAGDIDLSTVGDNFIDWIDPQSHCSEAWGLLAASKPFRTATYDTEFSLRNPGMMVREALALDLMSKVVSMLVLASF